MNTGWAHKLGYGSIIFGREDLVRVHQLVPKAHIIATHMGALNHCLCDRDDILQYAHDNELDEFVCAPLDGESVLF